MWPGNSAPAFEEATHLSAFSEVKPVTLELTRQKLLRRLTWSTSADAAGILLPQEVSVYLRNKEPKPTPPKRKAFSERNSGDLEYEKLDLSFG